MVSCCTGTSQALTERSVSPHSNAMWWSQGEDIGLSQLRLGNGGGGTAAMEEEI